MMPTVEATPGKQAVELDFGLVVTPDAPINVDTTWPRVAAALANGSVVQTDNVEPPAPPFGTTWFLSIPDPVDGQFAKFSQALGRWVSADPPVPPPTTPPSGPAGGDLGGNYPNPSVVTIDGRAVSAVVFNDDVRLGNARTPTAHHGTHEPGGTDAMAVDAIAGTGSLRTLGLGAQQAASGTDARFTNARAPTGAATGDLGGNYPNPTVNKVLNGKTPLTADQNLADVANKTTARSNMGLSSAAESYLGGTHSLVAGWQQVPMDSVNFDSGGLLVNNGGWCLQAPVAGLYLTSVTAEVTNNTGGNIDYIVGFNNTYIGWRSQLGNTWVGCGTAFRIWNLAAGGIIYPSVYTNTVAGFGVPYAANACWFDAWRIG